MYVHAVRLVALRMLLVVVPLVGAFTLSGCASMGLGGGGFNLVSLEDEWEMGRQIEQDLNRQLDLVDDATLQNYVENIGQRVVAQTSMARLPWRFHVVRDDEVNAFNAPGGLVYVNTGLIARAGSAAELASVIAHEVAHGVSRHGTERLTKVYGINVAASLLLGQDPGLAQQIAAQIAAGGAVAKFSRDDEREADRLGIRYMAAAGYDPEGMAAMFERLMSGGGSSGSVGQFFSTHPLTEDRIQAAQREARRYDRPGLVTNDRQYDNVRARARRFG